MNETTTTTSDELDDDDEELLTRQIFSKQLETIVIESEGSISIIDAVITLADIYSIDVTEVPKYLTQQIQEKIRDFAISENIIRKSSQRSLFKRQKQYDDYVAASEEAKQSSLTKHEALWI